MWVLHVQAFCVPSNPNSGFMCQIGQCPFVYVAVPARLESRSTTTNLFCDLAASHCNQMATPLGICRDANRVYGIVVPTYS